MNYQAVKNQAFQKLAEGNIACAIAKVLLEGFNRHYRIFRETSRKAKGCFERAEWRYIQQATKDRIDFYDTRVQDTVDLLKNDYRADQLDGDTWHEVKSWYINLLMDHKQPECAETFFNSVFCRIMHRNYFRNDFIFVRPAVSTEHLDADPPSYRCYYSRQMGLRRAFYQIIADFALTVPFADLKRDFRHVVRAWRRHLPRPFRLEANHQIQVLSSLFYRNKGAYLVGKIVNGNREYPFVIPILHDRDGRLYLDAVLVRTEDLVVLFSSTRAYFLVDMKVPSAYVAFLRSILPNKPTWELYTILGLGKHGKTLFYRDFLHHLKHSSDDFVIAPGIKGMVMVVFTLPSYPYVFKVIRDRFAPPKEVDQKTVRAKYYLVKHHDRVGRMADTLEYSEVAFPKDRFTPELLEELREKIPSKLEEINGTTIIINHVYIERRMIPLNLYLAEADEKRRDHVLDEFGRTLKDLAAANIFPGDLLFKNFGVTRRGRVVFYDYDEIDYLTNCNFRRIPPPRTPEEEMSDQPWYRVEEHDIFPEEMQSFLLSDPKIRRSFLKYHRDLLDVLFWQNVQRRTRAGFIEDVYPYPLELRFRVAENSRENRPLGDGAAYETPWSE